MYLASQHEVEVYLRGLIYLSSNRINFHRSLDWTLQRIAAQDGSSYIAVHDGADQTLSIINDQSNAEHESVDHFHSLQKRVLRG